MVRQEKILLSFVSILLTVGLGSGIQNVVDDFSGMLNPGQCSLNYKDGLPEAIRKITLLLFFRPNKYYEVPLNGSTAIMEHPKFENSLPTMLFALGWKQTRDDTMVYDLVEGAGEKFNCIFIGWEPISNDEQYSRPVSRLDATAEAIAQAIKPMLNNGIDIQLVVGFSLGAQLFALIGRSLDYKWHHVVSLDGAGPLFQIPVQCKKPLNKNDGECVQCLHTSSGVLGIAGSKCHQDYQVNGGRPPQPGHESFGEGHKFAVSLFTLSWQYSSPIVGRKCSSSWAFNTGLCDENEIATFNNKKNCRTRQGDFYLRTGDNVPYSLGRKGASSEKSSSVLGSSLLGLFG